MTDQLTQDIPIQRIDLLQPHRADRYKEYIKENFPNENIFDATVEQRSIWYDRLFAENSDEKLHDLKDALSKHEWAQNILKGLANHHLDSFKHSIRVAYIASELYKQFDPQYNQGDTNFYETFVLAALTHDGGKIHVDTKALDYPGRPPADIKEQLDAHPRLSRMIIEKYLGNTKSENAEQLQHISHMVDNHHIYQTDQYPPVVNRWDDLFEMRTKIIAAADKTDAIRSYREYRKGQPMKTAADLDSILHGDISIAQAREEHWLDEEWIPQLNTTWERIATKGHLHGQPPSADIADLEKVLAAV